jgi:hypothetical protein
MNLHDESFVPLLFTKIIPFMLQVVSQIVDLIIPIRSSVLTSLRSSREFTLCESQTLSRQSVRGVFKKHQILRVSKVCNLMQ